MKNMKIEKIMAQMVEANKAGKEEGIAEYKKYTNGAHTVIHAYKISVERGFDELVFDVNDCIWEKDVPDIISFCKEVGINWFVFGSGYSRAMETVMQFVDAGARVGKFVVKEYIDRPFGEDKVERLPGMRINL